MNKNRIQRKQYYLPESSQPGLILKTYLILFFVMVVAGTVFYFFGNRSLSMEYFQAHSTIKTTMQLLLPYLMVVNLVGLLGAFALVITFTHAIAGPVYKLKTIARKVESGDLTMRINFRKTDLIKELADIFNNILEAVSRHIQGFQKIDAKMNGLVPRINKLGKLPDEELVLLKKELLDIITEFENQRKKIKMTDK